MKKLLTFTLLLVATCVYSQKAFRYNGEEILTGKHTIYVNPKMKSKPKAYIYNNVNDALRCAEKLQQKRMANDTTWTCIYIEPSVYWIDNPNDTTIHTALPGEHIPYGMKLQLCKTKLIGMGSTPDDVVLAAQRGQTLAQMAVAWLLAQDVTSVLVGASSVKQLDDNLNAINNIAFTKEEMELIANS